jgi:hypothetical protein
MANLFNNRITKILMNGILLTDTKKECIRKIRIKARNYRENELLNYAQENELHESYKLCHIFIANNWPLYCVTVYPELGIFINTISIDPGNAIKSASRLYYQQVKTTFIFPFL